MSEEDGARRGFQKLCRYGCYTALVPYRWNSKQKQLIPGSRATLFFFNVHTNLTLVYLVYMWFRLIQTYLQGEFSLLSGLWAIGNISTTAALFTMLFYKNDIMQIANRLLSHTLLGEPVHASLKDIENDDKQKEQLMEEMIASVEAEDLKMMSRHMFFNLLLLYTNPEFHSFIVYQNPCAVNFVSSLVYPCKSAMDRPVTIWQQLPFLVFEAYITTKWQIVCSFMWSCIFMGLAVIGTQVKLLEKVRFQHFTTNAKYWDKVLLQYRKCTLMVKFINSAFRMYLTVLPAVSTVVVAMLIYGTVRLWKIDPQSNVMFPICAIRCGFEALTPLAMAGTLHELSYEAIKTWRKLLTKFWRPSSPLSLQQSESNTTQLKNAFTQSSVNRNAINDFTPSKRIFVQSSRLVSFGLGFSRKKRMLKAMQRSCHKLQCTSGPLFPFESSIVLVTVDNCLQMTVNLLVSFPAGD